MNKPLEYIAKTDGWVAGRWHSKGSTVTLTAAQAKYENVTLRSEAGPKVQLTGSLDDPTVKSSGLASPATAEEMKKGRDRK